MPADMNDYFKKKQPNSGGANNKTPNLKRASDNGGSGGRQAPQWIFIALAIILGLVFLKPFKIINSDSGDAWLEAQNKAAHFC